MSLPTASLIAFLAACSALSSPPEKQPPKVPVPAADAAKFAGTYTQDGGPVRTSLLLKPDGSYAATVTAWSFSAGEAIGNWRVRGKTLILSPFRETEITRDWFRHMDAMHIVHDDGDRFMFLRRIDVASLLAEPDLPAYCFVLHQWRFQRADQIEKQKGG